MKISDRLKEKIEKVLYDNEKMKNSLLSGDVEMIKQIGIISQKGFDPKEIVESFENDSTENLYNKAKQRIELQEIFKEILNELYIERAKERLKDKSEER